MNESKRVEVVHKINLLLDDLHSLADTVQHEKGYEIFSTRLREMAEQAQDWRYAVERSR